MIIDVKKRSHLVVFDPMNISHRFAYVSGMCSAMFGGVTNYISIWMPDM